MKSYKYIDSASPQLCRIVTGLKHGGVDVMVIVEKKEIHRFP